MCVNLKKNGVCEFGEESCTCVKKKFNGFWLIYFLLYFAYISWMQKEVFSISLM
jgi:hypothetical protein